MIYVVLGEQMVPKTLVDLEAARNGLPIEPDKK